MTYRADIAILFEHPEWQKPLFAALERRGIRYLPVDLKKAAFSDADEPLAPLYFNQASPSAYVLPALSITSVPGPLLTNGPPPSTLP